MTDKNLMEDFKNLPPEYHPYPKSLRRKGKNSFLIVRDSKKKYLAVKGRVNRFEGEKLSAGLILCPLTSINARLIREIFPELSPVPADKNISFGFGDRLGIATPAHAESAGAYPVFPIFAQQSVRENSRTGRTMQDVVDDATWGCLESGYKNSWGADADHLKNLAHLKEAAESGYSMYTIDLSDHIKFDVKLVLVLRLALTVTRRPRKYGRSRKKCYVGHGCTYDAEVLNCQKTLITREIHLRPQFLRNNPTSVLLASKNSSAFSNAFDRVQGLGRMEKIAEIPQE